MASTWCHQLKHEGGTVFLATLTALDRATMSVAAQAAYDKALSYFRNHSGRMAYPIYLQKGWQIGSGAASPLLLPIS